MSEFMSSGKVKASDILKSESPILFAKLDFIDANIDRLVETTASIENSLVSFSETGSEDALAGGAVYDNTVLGRLNSIIDRLNALGNRSKLNAESLTALVG